MTEINSDTILSLIVDFFSKVPGSGIDDIVSAGNKCIFVDTSYSSVAKAEVDRIMKSDPSMVPPAVDGTELGDCDDYALQVKATLTSLRRTQNIIQGGDKSPPAIAIVVAEQHALTAFITGSEGNLSLVLADASVKSQPISDDPGDATELLKYNPIIKLIYF